MKYSEYPTSNRVTLGILFVAALFRLVLLEMKPAHFDEGVNGWFVDEMARNGFYKYDPTNYHGPLHFYVISFFHTVFGRTILALRLPIVIISLVTIWLVTRFDRFIDRRICWLAAIAMAISPGMVFYTRYSIHEAWQVFFLVLLLWGIAGLWKFGTRGYLWAVGMGITGDILTKETYIIHYAAFALALITLRLWEQFSPSSGEPRAKRQWLFGDLFGVVTASVLLITFFYSGCFLDFPQLEGLYKTYEAWIETGNKGNGHEKPFYYWLQLISIYEWPVLIGLGFAIVVPFLSNDRLLRYISIYGVGTLVAYSWVPYKTPWCIISIIWPFYFLFGALVIEILTRSPRWVSSAIATLLAFSAAWSVHLNFFHYTDERHKYVYVQTFTDVEKLMNPLRKLVARDPENYHLTGHIMLSSYHPIPWLLGDFTHIGYYNETIEPENLNADFLLVEKSRIWRVEQMLAQPYFTTELRLRGAQEPSKLYLSYDKFREIFPRRNPEFIPRRGVLR